MHFRPLADAIHEKRGILYDPTKIILSFDPGHTTGWAVFQGYSLEDAGQIDTSDMEEATWALTEVFHDATPDIVVLEDYRVYKWRAKHHIGSEMLTTRVIGCIETIAVQRYIHAVVKQPASVAKGFCTDSKLKEWGFYKKGEKHARDAIRHGAYFILFGAIQQKDKGGSVVG